MVRTYYRPTYRLFFFGELELLHKGSETGDSGDLKNLKEGNCLEEGHDDGDVAVRDGREQINNEHTFEVVLCNLLRVSHFLAVSVEVSGAETQRDVNEEHDVDNQIQGGVSLVLLELSYHILKRYGKRVEDSHDEDQAVPNLLLFVKFLHNW